MRLILLSLAPFLQIACVAPSFDLLRYVLSSYLLSRFSESIALGFSFVLSLALRVSLVLFLRCALSSFYPFRCAFPSSYLFRCALPSSYLLRCVLPPSYLLRCVLSPSWVPPYPRVFALRVTLFLCCAFRLSFAPFAYRSLLVCVFLSLFSFSVIVRFPYHLFISPFLSPISYLLSSPLSHIFPPLSHISSRSPIPYLLPLPFLISPFLSPFSSPLPSPPLSLHISSFPLRAPFPFLPISPFLSSPILSSSPPISFSTLPYPLSSHPPSFSSPFLFSLPIPSDHDGIVVLPGGTSRPRWCNAQEWMERPMSVYIRVYTFARPSPASSAVSSLSGVGDPPGRARARILYYCKQSRKEGKQIFIRILFFQKKEIQKSF